MFEKPIIVKFDFDDSGETGSVWFVCVPNPTNNGITSGTVEYMPCKATSSIDDMAILATSSLSVDSVGHWTLQIGDGGSTDANITATVTNFNTDYAAWSAANGFLVITVLVSDSEVLDNGTAFGALAIVDVMTRSGGSLQADSVVNDGFEGTSAGGNYTPIDPAGYLGTAPGYGPSGNSVGSLNALDVLPSSGGTLDVLAYIGPDNVLSTAGGNYIPVDVNYVVADSPAFGLSATGLIPPQAVAQDANSISGTYVGGLSRENILFYDITQVDPFGTPTGLGAYSAPALSEIKSGVSVGGFGSGTRIDCPANKALTTASYGDPNAPTVGTVDPSGSGNAGYISVGL